MIFSNTFWQPCMIPSMMMKLRWLPNLQMEILIINKMIWNLGFWEFFTSYFWILITNIKQLKKRFFGPPFFTSLQENISKLIESSFVRRIEFRFLKIPTRDINALWVMNYLGAHFPHKWFFKIWFRDIKEAFHVC